MKSKRSMSATAFVVALCFMCFSCAPVNSDTRQIAIPEAALELTLDSSWDSLSAGEFSTLAKKSALSSSIESQFLEGMSEDVRLVLVARGHNGRSPSIMVETFPNRAEICQSQGTSEFREIAVQAQVESFRLQQQEWIPGNTPTGLELPPPFVSFLGHVRFPDRQAEQTVIVYCKDSTFVRVMGVASDPPGIRAVHSVLQTLRNSSAPKAN